VRTLQRLHDWQAVRTLLADAGLYTLPPAWESWSPAVIDRAGGERYEPRSEEEFGRDRVYALLEPPAAPSEGPPGVWIAFAATDPTRLHPPNFLNAVAYVIYLARSETHWEGVPSGLEGAKALFGTTFYGREVSWQPVPDTVPLGRNETFAWLVEQAGGDPELDRRDRDRDPLNDLASDLVGQLDEQARAFKPLLSTPRWQLHLRRAGWRLQIDNGHGRRPPTRAGYRKVGGKYHDPRRIEMLLIHEKIEDGEKIQYEHVPLAEVQVYVSRDEDAPDLFLVEDTYSPATLTFTRQDVDPELTPQARERIRVFLTELVAARLPSLKTELDEGSE
jgi:hypothetical protein